MLELLVGRADVQVKEAAGTRFSYLDMGSEDHGRPSYRLWVSGRLVSVEAREFYDKPVEIVKFPARADIIRTEKGSLVLRPSDEKAVYNLLVPCGYRGTSSFEILSPEGAVVHKYWIYRSPRGNCGVSAGALVVVPADVPLTVRWERTGRLYGGPPYGVTILYPDGREEVLDSLTDGLEEIATLRQLVE